MKLLVHITFPDDFLVATLTEREKMAAIQTRLQDAVDREYPNAPTGTVQVTYVGIRGEPSESDLIGPLG